jgi:hypothetical protein
VRGGCIGHATIVKAEVVEACITIPLLHQSVYIEQSNPFFKRLDLSAFFSLRGNGRARKLEV